MQESGLKNKVVIITGAANGIGRATALRFAQEGARVAAWDVNNHSAKELLQAFGKAGSAEAMFLTVDVTDAHSVQTAVDDVIKTWGRIDVLVNNAGILRDGLLVKVKDGVFSSMTEEQYDTVVSVNQKGVFLCTRAVVPHIITGGGGVVLNASSVVGLYGNFGQTNYIATKAAVIAMTKTWARELGRHNIRVNAVAPGFVATEMVKQMPEKFLNSMVAHTPLGRLGRPEEIADAYCWLASDRATFVTGTVLSVDGGVVPGT